MLVEALTGKDYRDFVRSRLIESLELEQGVFISLPRSEWARTAPMHMPDVSGTLTFAPVEASATFRQARFAAGGAHGTARAMAACHQMLAQGGTLGTARLFGPRTIDSVTRNFTVDRVDEQIGIPMHRGLGPFSRGDTLDKRGLGHDRPSTDLRTQRCRFIAVLGGSGLGRVLRLPEQCAARE